MRSWVQLELVADDAGVLRASISASAGDRMSPSRPVAGLSRAQLEGFGRATQRFAARGADLTAELRDWAQGLYRGVFGGEIGQIVDVLRGADQGRVLVRLMISDPALRGLPWEAMRGPTATDGPLATSAAVQLVRGVYSTEPAVPREVRDALRLLVVAPADMAAAAEDLRLGLEPAIGAGAVQWLRPCVGDAARWPALLSRLQGSPKPHVLHIVCHGRVQEGRPELLLDPSEGRWLPVEVLASALAATGGPDLRLVYLESCSGAEPGALATAAELLATRGVEAVIAHLWPVRALSARTLAQIFYTSLVGPAAGDVASSLTSARLGLAGLGTAEMYCPVLVLRGSNPSLFDLRRRVLSGARPAAAGSAAVDAELQRTLEALSDPARAGRSLILGERIDAQGRAPGQKPLLGQLSAYAPPEGQGSLASLMQRYEMHEEREELKAVVAEALDPISADGSAGPPEIIDLLARIAGPGLSLTLLWLPLLEEALAFHHPDREIIVAHPLRPDGLDRMRLFRRGPGETRWTRLAELPERLDFSSQHVVVRLYGGYSPMTRTLLGDPALTEDDQLLNLADIEALPEQILAFLRHTPMLIAGISPGSWSHRELLRRLTGQQPLPGGSLAVLGAGADPGERRYWGSGQGSGARGGVQTLEFDEVARLAAALRGT